MALAPSHSPAAASLKLRMLGEAARGRPRRTLSLECCLLQGCTLGQDMTGFGPVPLAVGHKVLRSDADIIHRLLLGGHGQTHGQDGPEFMPLKSKRRRGTSKFDDQSAS